MDKRKKILLVLLVVFLIILIFRIMNPYTQKRVSKLTNTGKRKQAALKTVYTSGKEEPVEISSVMLNLLSNPPRHSGTMHKNIFFKENHNMDTVFKPIESDAVLASVKDPARQIKEELSQLRVFGFYKEEKELALFFEKGNNIMIVRKGDRIDGKYFVENITKDSIFLRAENIDEAIHIDLEKF